MMPALRNIREEAGQVRADFTTPDGRPGSVAVATAEHQAHGEAALQQEAQACCDWARLHAYRSPEDDRYNELR